MLGLDWYTPTQAGTQLQACFCPQHCSILCARDLVKAKELCTFEAGPWTALHSDSRDALWCVLMYSCVSVCVLMWTYTLYTLSSALLPFSLPPSHHTVAMATILIDPVPSNTKCFSEPKVKPPGSRQRHAGVATAPAEEDDGSEVCFLGLLRLSALLLSRGSLLKFNMVQIVTFLC